MGQITKTHLWFLEKAKAIFQKDKVRETAHDEELGLIALRMGEDRDCVNIYELGEEVANFVQQMEPAPLARNEVREFGYDMEAQLKINDHKGHWKNEHHEFLTKQLSRQLHSLNKALANTDKDKYDITMRCANIANYAMMIADNEGTHL